MKSKSCLTIFLILLLSINAGNIFGQKYYANAYYGAGIDGENISVGNKIYQTSATSSGSISFFGGSLGRNIYKNLYAELGMSYFKSKNNYSDPSNYPKNPDYNNSSTSSLRLMPAIRYNFGKNNHAMPFLKVGCIAGIWGQFNKDVHHFESYPDHSTNTWVLNDSYVITKYSGGMGKGFFMEAGCDIHVVKGFNLSFNFSYALETKTYVNAIYTKYILNGVNMNPNNNLPVKYAFLNPEMSTLGLNIGIHYTFCYPKPEEKKN
ncbi:MAG: hypothetical protein WCL14_08425 [Bacteroidota bacterium]